MKKITVIASAVLAVLSLGLAGCKKVPAKAGTFLLFMLQNPYGIYTVSERPRHVLRCFLA